MNEQQIDQQFRAVRQSLLEIATELRDIKRRQNKGATGERAGNFTPGSVLFASAAGIAAEDNASLFWDDTTNRLLIGTATTPAGGGKLILRGTDSSYTAGPHIQTHGSADVYPILQVLSYFHDNVGFAFDAYYEAGWKSSDAGSNFWLYKTADLLKIYANTGVAAGSATTLNEIFQINPVGNELIAGTLGLNSATTTRLDMNEIANLATNGVAQISTVAADLAMVFVLANTGGMAMYILRGTAHATVELLDSAATYSITAGTVGTNIYWSAGNSRYELENKTGGTVTYHIVIMRY